MCMLPGYKKNGEVYPCGKCPTCIKRRISAWSFRLIQELKTSNSAHFITLTYDNKNPPTDMFGNLSLAKHDLQCFFKRLRKAHTKCDSIYINKRLEQPLQPAVTFLQIPKPLKYFAVGEYGHRTHRPHYHIIMFNAKIELIQDAWGIKDRHTGVSAHIGQVDYGDERGVCEASIGYCFKYLQKARRRYWKGELRQREFSVCSKGIGIEYLTEDMAKWHAADVGKRMYCTTRDGKKISMPRYYKDKIFFDGERCLAQRELMQKLLVEAQKVRDHQKHWWEEKQAIKAAFKKMHLDYETNKTL